MPCFVMKRRFAMYNEDNSKQYVGDLGIICMPGCEPFVESVQNYIQG